MNKETEKDFIITQLNRLGIYETPTSRPLEELTYHTLLSMLAMEQAVRA